MAGTRKSSSSSSKSFGGKKAAPFVKGGGRSKTSPRDHKGRPRSKS